MAKVILKSPYMKPGRSAGLQRYIQYIATRAGVEAPEKRERLAVTGRLDRVAASFLKQYPDCKDIFEYEDYRALPTEDNARQLILAVADAHPEIFQSRSGYVKYMANRPGVERKAAHGLFSSAEEQPDLKAVQEELDSYEGNVWTHIISLRREDAARLGYDRADAWQALLKKNQLFIAQAMRIKPENFRWYAAFHNESHHPHVHMIAYSTDPKEAYLTREGIQKIKSRLARDIFQQDLLQIYEQETADRNALRKRGRDRVEELVSRINRGGEVDPLLAGMLARLADQLRHTKGKKVYGYLPKGVKKLVDAIVDRLGTDPDLAALYEEWCRQRNRVAATYQDSPLEEKPLSQVEEFKPIRNAVVLEALRLTEPLSDLIQRSEQDAGQELSEEGDSVWTDRSTERSSSQYWSKEYKAARALLYGKQGRAPDPERAYRAFMGLALQGNPLAQYDLGRLRLLGLGCDKDEEIAQEWFAKALSGFKSTESVAKKKGYWQYRIGKMFAMGYGVERDYSLAGDWYEKAVHEGSPFAAYALGCLTFRGEGRDPDPERAHDLFLLAAEDEKYPNAYAMVELAKMYHQGIGVEPDEEKSGEWYSRAYPLFAALEESAPDDKLQYRLGYMTLHGLGTEVDKKKAAGYFEKAAAVKNKDAVYALGKLLVDPAYSGFNPTKGAELLRCAALEDENDNAAVLLGRLLLKGEWIQRNTKEALAFLFRAANRQNVFAMTISGRAFLYGDGIPEDKIFGREMLTAAANLGGEYAQTLLNRLNQPREISPEQIASAAVSLLAQAARMIENEIHDPVDPQAYALDSKLQRKDREKKLAQGQKLG